MTPPYDLDELERLARARGWIRGEVVLDLIRRVRKAETMRVSGMPAMLVPDLDKAREEFIAHDYGCEHGHYIGSPSCDACIAARVEARKKP